MKCYGYFMYTYCPNDTVIFLPCRASFHKGTLPYLVLLTALILDQVVAFVMVSRGIVRGFCSEV